MGNNKLFKSQQRTGWLMAAPATLLIFFFLVLPFLMAFGFSLTNQRIFSPNPTEFVGLHNFKNMLSVHFLTVEAEKDETGAFKLDNNGNYQFPKTRKFTRNNPDYPHLNKTREWMKFDVGKTKKFYVLARDLIFMKALTITILFVLITAPLQAGIALLLAMLINQPLRGINIYRTIYFMPVVISMVVVSVLWKFIYDGENGLLNALLHFFSVGYFEPVDWLGQTDTALGAIIAMSIWQGVGFHMIIWLAGLQTIPVDHYEVARLEGANKWQTFSNVTWPGLRNTAILVMVIITMQAFTLFPQVAVMTRGGLLDSTQSLVFQMVERGYGKQDIAGGSTISVFLFLFVLSISLFQRYITREKIHG